MSRWFVFICILFTFPVSAQQLVFAYGPGNGAPFAIINGQQLTGGLFKDIGDALSAHSGLGVAYRQVPTKRASSLLISGEVNALCLTHPDWIEGHEQLFWSPVLAQDFDHLMTLKKESLHIQTFEDLQGLNVGAMTGYIYFPKLMNLFSQGQAIRRDFNNLDALYASLFAERLDAIVDSRISIYYRQKIQADYRKLQVSKLVVYQYDLYCAFNVSLLPVKEVILQALQTMVNNNQIKTIISKYR